MMSKKRPQLRFEGFTDDWEEHKLGDFLKTPEKVKAHIQSKDDLMTLKLNLGGLESGSNRETLELGSTIYYKRKAGQFIYGKQNFFNGSMAIIPIDLDGKATSGDVPSLDVIGILSEYLYVYVSRGDYWKSKESEASGTGSKRIHEKTLQGFDIKVPSTQNEQRKIGSFFKQLDDTIALHQRKLDLLKEQKKGYLQKMFPKNGAKVPELRFAGFADDWEERKLGGIGKTYTGLTGKSKEDFGHGDAKFVTYMNVFQNPKATLEQLENVEIDPRQNEVKKGDVFFTTSSETPEEVGMSSVWTHDINNIYLNSFTFAYRPTIKFDLDYLAFMLRSQSVRKKIIYLAQGISRYNISKTKMMDISVPIPVNFEEQQKIGAFFKQLDDIITLHQRKLDLLKETKKGFLQKMFV
ncbi:restriction endonuclease subunit S [Enterococcus gallinarum]|uniref:restriction endonuclease subunit S n=1 Tax=Enterococcus gallinarum TaxID=1353 RepID=UPI0035DEF740